MAVPCDEAGQVRPNEELQVEALRQFLSKHMATKGLSVKQFAKGFSNLTYLLETETGEWVLRRPPFGAKIRSAHDMGREFRVLDDLSKRGAKVPKPLVYCEDESVIGAPFYVMERVKGVILRQRAPKGVDLKPGLMESLSSSFVAQLVDLHGLDMTGSALLEHARPQGYVARQIEGWAKRYRRAKTDEIASLERAAAWLADHLPAEMGTTLIHNDFKYDNLVLDPDDLSRIKAILDWEMATVACPLMDLGTTLGYWAEADDPEALRSFSLTSLPGNMSRRELVDRYQELSGRDVADPVFYWVYGLFKIAVIAQQIYARFCAGHSKDPRFGQLIYVVQACGAMAVKAIQSKQI